MLPNPTIILVLLVTVIGLSFSSYRYGKHVCQGEHATKVATIQEQAIDAANTESKAATKLAVQQIAREAAARVRAAGIRRKGEIDATDKARPECARDQQSMELLQSALDAANGQGSAGNSMPDSVRPTSATSQR